MRTRSSQAWATLSGRAVLFCTTTGSTLILRHLLLRGRSEKLLRGVLTASWSLGLTVFQTLFSSVCPVGRSFIWLMCSILVLSYVIFLRYGSTPPWFLFPRPGKDHSNPSKYRPISLLSSISKVFERIILKRLNGFISTVNILPEHQFGLYLSSSLEGW
jgi:hypothetical protein